MSISLCEAMENLHARITLTAEPSKQTVVLANAGEEYLINVTMDPLGLADAQKFSYSEGLISYTGVSPLENTFIGMAVIESDKNSTVSLNGYLNDLQVMSEEAIFGSAGSRQPFHVASSFTMQPGTELYINASSDTANTTITLISYTLVYDGYECGS